MCIDLILSQVERGIQKENSEENTALGKDEMILYSELRKASVLIGLGSTFTS